MPTKTVNIFGNRKLDARPDRLDLRDRPYIPPVVTLPQSCPCDDDVRTWLPSYVGQELVLDQQAEGSCTGFGLACVIHYLLWRQKMLLGEEGPLTRVSTRMLYHLARFYDEWPGEDYEGSSCRGALKAWHRHGVCSDEIWPYLNADGENVFVPPSPGWEHDAMQRRLGVYYRVDHRSVVDMQAAILEVGAVYVSANVHDGWTVRTNDQITGHASLPKVRGLTSRESMGGHAFALVGYNPTGFVVQNSWGHNWGQHGFAVLPYDEWVCYGTDAWVCALGVPGDHSESSSVLVREPRTAVPAGYQSCVSLGQQDRIEVNSQVAPWTLAKACHHSIVMGNEGRPLNRIVAHENGADSVEKIVAVAPKEWLNEQAPGARRIMLYAHGGLNSEEESLKRIQVLAPYFMANGIYPLFFTWKTGPVETLSHILEDELVRLLQTQGRVGDRVEDWVERLSDTTDRTLEVVAGPLVKPIWSQMKQNAKASVEHGRSTKLIAEHLANLTEVVEGLEIHLIGHSAGSILLGYFLDVAQEQKLTVHSCSLYAPACTITFANKHYRRAVDNSVLAKRNLHVHVLSDAREREDTVGPYRKSLLYLVSRALESAHKTPLLGLANVFCAATQAADIWNEAEPIQVELTRWSNWWKGQADSLHILDERRVSTGTIGLGCQASHGCFDNHADTIIKTLTRILGDPPQHTVESLDY